MLFTARQRAVAAFRHGITINLPWQHNKNKESNKYTRTLPL
ncbi:Hypothetical protein ETEE_0169 [Edwardsiella anguillarum ET080813]|uniref:Uncharacterized protein n=1 Tax=Edwardsiella anguillarum ET080813 TaxID=667120 RepID=A0A076LJB0_9GAMM|nr:Hypothetical protein ETEE_0169 [Edwardsiella anguillarum ET080813]